MTPATARNLVAELRAAHAVLSEYREYAEELRAIGRGYHPTDNVGRGSDSVLQGIATALADAALDEPEAVELDLAEISILSDVAKHGSLNVNRFRSNRHHITALAALRFVVVAGGVVNPTTVGLVWLRNRSA